MDTYGHPLDPRIEDMRTGGVLEKFAFPLEKVSEDLHGTLAILTVRDGVLQVEELTPRAAPAFRAMPNAMLEEVVRSAMKGLETLSRAAEEIVDDAGRRIGMKDVVLYPHDLPNPPKPIARPAPRYQQDASSVPIIACIAIIGTLLLVALGHVHPMVLLLVPIVAGMALAIRRNDRLMGLLPGMMTNCASYASYARHVRCAQVQARSVERAVDRARGLIS